jgi:NAD-dependent SIR2 family protein deacetylase
MNLLARETASLQAWLSRHRRLVILTGAGLSAASGIPTYRDTRGRWQHSKPITHGDFVADPRTRQRYWARSMLGWPVIREAHPNTAHLALVELERRGAVELLITQNVDRLHQRAGSRNALDLHGRLDRVICLHCNREYAREAIQCQLLRNNDHLAHVSTTLRPDGDTALAEELVATVRSPDCPDCSGVLMPAVVFFGGSVPAVRVQQCRQALESADALLAIGTSLQVYSGYRFCRHAQRLGKPLAIINPGSTRADDIATIRFQSECGPLLQDVLARSAGRAQF